MATVFGKVHHMAMLWHETPYKTPEQHYIIYTWDKTLWEFNIQSGHSDNWTCQF